MSPRFVLGRENVPCVAEVVNRSLKADCTDFTYTFIASFPASCFDVKLTGKPNFDVISRHFVLDLGHSSLVVPIKIQIFFQRTDQFVHEHYLYWFPHRLTIKEIPRANFSSVGVKNQSQKLEQMIDFS